MRFKSDILDCLIKVWMDPTLQILSLELELALSCVQRGGLPSVFIKVKWILEKVIHEDSTRYIVESLQDRMNKRKTASVYTPALVTLQVKSLGVIPKSRKKRN